MDTPRWRKNDHSTSVSGGVEVAKRAPTQKIRLLRQFKLAGDLGLTDEEAAQQADLLGSCFWKRCGELRGDELIVYTESTRKGGAGVARLVSVITPEGVEELKNR